MSHGENKQDLSASVSKLRGEASVSGHLPPGSHVPEVLCICCCIYSFWDIVESPVSWRGGYSFARSISVSYMVGNLTAPVFRDPRLTVPRITSR